MDSSRYRQSLYSAFSSLCSQYGENLLFRFEGRDITYAETGDLVRRRAAFLQREGYGKGDIIAMMAVNSPDWCVTFMAIAAMGGIVLPLDTSLQPEQTGPMLARAGAKAFFASRAFEGFAGDLASYEISTSGNMGDASSFSAADVSFDDMAAMLFTSGTTGNPKLVSLSHLNILHVACVCTELEEYSPSDVTLALLPLFHIYALEATFMAPMVSGSSIVMLNSLKGPDIMKALADFPITIFPAAPLMWELFFKGLTAKIGVGTTKYRIFMFFVNHAPLLKALGLGFLVRKIFDPVHAAFGRSHRFFISGGAPLKREYFTYYRNMGFRFIEGYGLSETTGPIAIPYYKNSMAGSVGCPIPGNEVKIRNINEDGIGEIWFRGDAVMKGYYSNEAANRESFDDWGFFNTGDLGRLDRKGNIYVTGRMKNVIVLDSGKKAYPEELEFYYKQSPMISEIAVIDRVSDGRVQVYGVIVPVSRSRNVYSHLRDEMARLNRALPDYRRVKSFAVSFDELPKNSTRKILYGEVKARLEAGLYQTGEGEGVVLRDILRATTAREEQVIISMKKRFSRKEIFSNMSPLDLGMDSLGMIEAVTALEEDLGIAIDVEELWKKQSMAEIMTYLSALDPASPDRMKENVRQEQVKTRSGRILNFINHCVIAFLGFLSRRIWKVELLHGERLAANNCIFISNHQSYLDMIWISFCIPRKYRGNIYVTAKRRFFFLRYFFPLFPMLLLNENNNVEVLKVNSELLRQGKSLFIFPEGTRTGDGQMSRFHSGAAYLAKTFHCRIIPIAVTGAFDIWPRQRKFPRLFSGLAGRVSVGEPVDPDRYDSVESLNQALQDTVSALIAHSKAEIRN